MVVCVCVCVCLEVGVGVPAWLGVHRMYEAVSSWGVA